MRSAVSGARRRPLPGRRTLSADRIVSAACASDQKKTNGIKCSFSAKLLHSYCEPRAPGTRVRFFAVTSGAKARSLCGVAEPKRLVDLTFPPNRPCCRHDAQTCADFTWRGFAVLSDRGTVAPGSDG